MSDAVLIIDAMAIHKGTWWDAKKKTYVGQVDYGTALIEAEEDLATEVLLKILKAAEVIFRRRVIEQGKSICFDKNLSAAIQSAVVEQLGSAVFDQSQEHFFDHSLSIEADHLKTTLLRLVTEKYVLLCLKTYSKRFTEMVVHKNEPSLRHRLTKTILFKNQ